MRADRGVARAVRATGLDGNVAIVTDASEPRVLVRDYGGLGHLTLNRPRAINALDIDMIRDLAAALDGWEHDLSLIHI